MIDYFKKNADILTQKKLFLLDMDGTIYLENDLFEGVKEWLYKIREKGGRFVFITNNSSKSVSEYVKKLKMLGIDDVSAEDFFTSSQCSAMMLKEKFAGQLIYAQGTRSFIEELSNYGLNVTEQYDENAVAIIVAFDTELTAEKLRVTSKMLTKNDIPYYATNPDWVCPVDFGYIPDCGSMCFGYEKATGKRPVFIGKPEPTMAIKVMEKFGYTKEQTVVIGDRLYTDIASGVNAGVDTVFVLSGEATLSDLEVSDVKPTFVLEKVTDIEL